MEVLPFKNDIDIIEVSGSVLLTILEHSVNDYNPQKKHGKFLQYSGWSNLRMWDFHLFHLNLSFNPFETFVCM